MRTNGKISSWNDEKGFGFITPAAGGKQVFVHINAFSNRHQNPEVNQLISYALSTDRQGRPCAVNVTLAGERLPHERKHRNGSLPALGAVIFLVIVGVSVLISKIPPWVIAVYMVASLLTFIIYAADKSAAKNGNRRISENTLHMFSLAGGWPGALIAQQKLHHKSRKQSFRAVFWVTVILNGVAFIWLLTPAGATELRSLIASVL